jgi:beta-lactamase family protein
MVVAGSIMVVGVLVVGSGVVRAYRHAGADQAQTAGTPSASPSPSPSPSPTSTAIAEHALSAALDQELDGTSTTLSLAIRDNRTGATLTYHPSTRYQTASTVKVDILATLLYQCKQQNRDLTSYEKQEAELMITQSDNNAASELYEDIGSDSGLNEANETFGLTHTTAGTDEMWGVTLTNPVDQLTLLDTVLRPDGPLGADRSAYLRGLMGQVESDQQWGISAAVDGDEDFILKNGWDIYRDGWNINSIGRITGPDSEVTLCIYSTGSPDMSTGIKRVEKAAKLAREQLDTLSPGSDPRTSHRPGSLPTRHR